MPESQWDQLIHRYLDRTITPAELAHLNKAVEELPAVAQQLAEASILHNALDRHFTIAVGTEELEQWSPQVLPRAKHSGPPKQADGRRRPRRRTRTQRRSALPAMVILLGVFALAAVWFSNTPSVMIDRGVLTRADSGKQLSAGSALEPGVSYRATTPVAIAVVGEHQVAVTSASTFFFNDVHTWSIKNGQMTCTVAKQVPQTSFQVTSPHLRVDVTGTIFTVEAQNQHSLVRVSEGSVHCRTGDNEQVAIAAGYMLDSRWQDGKPRLTQRLLGKPWDWNWQQNANAGKPQAERATWMAQADQYGWFGNRRIEANGVSRSGMLWQLPAETVAFMPQVTLEAFIPDSGMLQVLFVIKDGNRHVGNIIAKQTELTPGWQTITFAATDFYHATQGQGASIPPEWLHNTFFSAVIIENFGSRQRLGIKRVQVNP